MGASAIPAAPPTGSYGERAVRKMEKGSGDSIEPLGLLVTSVRMGVTFWRYSSAALVSNRCRTVFRQRAEMGRT